MNAKLGEYLNTLCDKHHEDSKQNGICIINAMHLECSGLETVRDYVRLLGCLVANMNAYHERPEKDTTISDDEVYTILTEVGAIKPRQFAS